MASPRSNRAECHAVLQVENGASRRPTRAECYALLEVEDDAPIEVVKKAFRTLALVYHPDKAGAAGIEKFQKLLEAYVTLVSPPPEPASPEPAAGMGLGPAAQHPLLTLFQAASNTLLSILPQAASDTLLSVLPPVASDTLLLAPPQTATDTPLLAPPPQAANDTLTRQDIDTPLPTEIPEVLRHSFITLSRAHFALSTRRTSAWNSLDVLCKAASDQPFPAYEDICEDRDIYDSAFDRIGSMINDSSDKLSGPQTDTARYGVDGLKLALWSARLELLEGAMLRISQELEELRDLVAERRSHGKLSWYIGSKDAGKKMGEITDSIDFMVDERLAPALAHDGLD